MRSAVGDILPPPVLRSLAKLGADIATARKRRRLTVAAMVERVGVAKSTYLRMERGDPSVSLGAYAMTFFALGFGSVLGDLLDAGDDDQGLLLEAERLPKRVRTPKQP